MFLNKKKINHLAFRQVFHLKIHGEIFKYRQFCCQNGANHTRFWCFPDCKWRISNTKRLIFVTESVSGGSDCQCLSHGICAIESENLEIRVLGILRFLDL